MLTWFLRLFKRRVTADRMGSLHFWIARDARRRGWED